MSKKSQQKFRPPEQITEDHMEEFITPATDEVPATPEVAAPTLAGKGTQILATALTDEKVAAEIKESIKAALDQPHLQALPAHLANKVASTGIGKQSQCPPELVNVVIRKGKEHRARAPAEIVWATWAQTQTTGDGVPAQELLERGKEIKFGAHSLLAYLKRGWLVKA